MTNSSNGSVEGKRVGLIVPSTNTVMEPDLYRHLPVGTTVHTSRMLLEGSVTIEAEELMLDVYLPECARQIGTLMPDVVVFGCTSAGALRGPAYEQELAGEISKATGAPTITIMGAVVDELNRLDVKTVAVLTPYSEEINNTIKESLEASGFTVPYINGMDVKGAFNIAAVSPGEIIQYAEEQLRGIESDCLFVSCANLKSVDVLEELRQAAGRPVVTSNQAVLEGVKRTINVAD
ncbi:MAG: aspartate/glutamate racemase family protein [Chloroflexota bacterium]|nr:aspartate/glutamate racemase family protein [Chloroflexota bacterium]